MSVEIKIPDSFDDNFIPEMMSELRFRVEALRYVLEYGCNEKDIEETVEECLSIIDAIEDYHGGF
ncbi:hypothetical protein [Escherichia coli]|uniref:hypothetical protein n=1 Tax=Escherichia coli TaxID=562 RepID=UPI000CFCE9D7|nr:hypothetical protein [Escherichia coli]